MASNSDLAMIDVRLLRLFDLLYSTHSVTRAAQDLNLSQPTVSVRLGKLRRHFKDPLFVRASDGMQPTSHASALIGPVRDVLMAMEKLADADSKFDPVVATRRFRMCMPDSSDITILPTLMAYMRDVAPSVRLETVRIDDKTALALQSGEVDLAMVSFLTGLGAGFYQQALFTQDWICLTRRDHPRVVRWLTRRAYETESHIGITSSASQQLLEDALGKHQISRRIAVMLPGVLGLGHIVMNTDLIATLPRQIGEMLAKQNGLRIHKCPVPVPNFVVRQHWHARYHHDAGNRWMRGVCDKLFRKMALTGAGGVGSSCP